MFHFLRRRRRRGTVTQHVDFDEVLVDETLPAKAESVSRTSLLELPFSRYSFYFFIGAILLLFAGLLLRVAILTTVRGEEYALRASSNSIQRLVSAPARGLIYDRKGRILVDNVWVEGESDAEGEIQRSIRNSYAFSHLVGYVGSPNEEDVSRDAELGHFDYLGRDGVEFYYDDALRGALGVQLQEIDAVGAIISEGVTSRPVVGDSLVLTIDAELQEYAHTVMDAVMRERGFKGGSVLLFDVNNGEILTLANVPSFNANKFSKGISKEELDRILNNPNSPFFNRAISGRYSPGSIMKPYIGYAALAENIVDTSEQFYSSGALAIPDPYREGAKTIFKDWKVHEWVNFYKAIAVSSNVYFYIIGGGNEFIDPEDINRKDKGLVRGIGIRKIHEWLSRFAFNEKTGIDLIGEATGIVPSPEIKAELHPEDPDWRIGDTYLTSIGQGDTIVTPVAAARALSLIANKTHLPTPHVGLARITGDAEERMLSGWETERVHLDDKILTDVHRGMQDAVRYGTASALSGHPLSLAAKTGTAQAEGNRRNHAWFIGFAPAEDPQIGMVVFLESGPAENQVGGVSVAAQIVNWIQSRGGVSYLLSRSTSTPALLIR